MALFDVMFEFSDAQILTDSSAAATNVLDMQAADREMGAGTPIWLNVRVEQVFAGGTSVVTALVNESDATIDGSSIVIWQTPAVVTADLVAGHWIMRMPLPVNFDELRYLGIYYTLVGTFTTGTINAWLDHGPQSSYDTQVTTSNI